MGGLQSLISQMGGQGAFGNPYVSPALGGGEKIPQAGTAMAPSYKDMPANYQEAKDAFHAQGGGMTAGQAMTRDQFGNMWSSTAANEFDSFYNKNYGGTGGQQPIATPPQQLGAVNATYTPAGSGAGLSSLVSGSSGSLNSMPSMSGAGGAGGSGGPFPLEGKYGIVKMANGGLASAAQNMAGRGRDGDSMLVHMSPGEVKGLQALAMAHGGSLSINPDTGLVEASFLKRILPMVAGAALTPFLGPMGAALATGGFETVRTGDIGKGLTAGLGAFGGANLASNLATAAVPNAAPGFAQTPTGLNVIPSEAASMGATTTPTTFANMSEGVKNLSNTPGGTADFLGANKMNLAMAASPVVSDAMTPKGPAIPGQPEEDPRYKGSPYRYNLASNFAGSSPTRPSPYYNPTGLGYAAQGGSTNDIMLAAGGTYEDEPMGDTFAMGGSIGGYSDGGRMLKGPGDGMSDSIPAMIGKRQPARLADGEFVVPADVVSHLGNGSTDAGAKHLYSMMDKVRKARTGTKKQGKQIKPQKYMPA
jgi:hypothetical protein